MLINRRKCEKIGNKKFLTGNYAVANAVKLARVGVISVYPITPQTPIAERLASFVASSELKAEYINIESEHSALAAVLGACAAGARSFTATSSQGLAYMHEMLSYASGGRFPVVLAVANRALAPPWNIWGEHQDAIQQRDTGCIQLYVETAQEALDTTLQAFKIAENPDVFTPVLICLDGFHLSHAEELVEIPDQSDVDKFLPPYEPSLLLNPDKPLSLAIGATGKEYVAWRYEQAQALETAKNVIVAVDKEFGEIFGRQYGGLIDVYNYENAELIVIIMGSFAGEVRDVIDYMRGRGIKVGMLRLRAFRPFPNKVIRHYLSSVKKVVVIDRDFSYGNEGAVCSEVRAALYGLYPCPTIINYIGGLGVDLTIQDIRSVILEAMQAKNTEERGIIFQYMGKLSEH